MKTPNWMSAGLAMALAMPLWAAQDKPAPVAKPSLTVTTARPVQAEWAQKINANGSLAAWQEAIIGSEANGLRLTEVRVNVGDAVRKGDVLAVMASDAFFPFPDCVEIAGKAGIVAVTQPGGSIKDQDSVDYCDANNIAMVMTGIRHFKH